MDVAAIVTVIFAVAPELNETEFEEKPQLPLAGAPLQLRFTVELKPLIGVSVRVKVAEPPDGTVAVGGETDIAKSVPVPVSATDCGLAPALSVTVIDPVLAPDDAGENVTLTVQLAPTASDDPQSLVWL